VENFKLIDFSCIFNISLPSEWCLFTAIYFSEDT